MLPQKIQDAINDQINAELYSSYLYLSMAAYFQSLNLKGFANWMEVQAQEELVHVGKFYRYIADRGGRVTLGAIAAPREQWDSPLETFEAAYNHEISVTQRINKLVDLARAESDHATHNFLQWFVAEQVEEEANADQIVQQLKLIGGNTYGLFMMDRELAARTFVIPPAGGAAA